MERALSVACACCATREAPQLSRLFRSSSLAAPTEAQPADEEPVAGLAGEHGARAETETPRRGGHQRPALQPGLDVEDSV